MYEDKVLELVSQQYMTLRYKAKPVSAELQDDGYWRVYFDNGSEDLYAEFDLENLEKELTA